MTTPQDIFDNAYGYSTKNVPTEVAEEGTELFKKLNRVMDQVYSIASLVNPTYFGKKTTVTAPGAGSPWPEPSDAETIFYIQDGSGTEVVVVRIQEQDAEPGKPNVYSLGRKLYTVGGSNDPDPSSDNLEIFYSASPTDPADKDSDLDATWDEDFNELLSLEIALYLAHKDGRPEEYEFLLTERDRELQRFVNRLDSHQAGVRSRFGSTIEINTQRIETFRAMLSGGREEAA